MPGVEETELPPGPAGSASDMGHDKSRLTAKVGPTALGDGVGGRRLVIVSTEGTKKAKKIEKEEECGH